MLAEVLRRLLATIPAGVVALAVRRCTSPGDPAVIIAGDYATTDDIAHPHPSWVSTSLPHQVAIWLGRVVRGDLGTSIFSGLPVSTLIGQRAATDLADPVRHADQRRRRGADRRGGRVAQEAPGSTGP